MDHRPKCKMQKLKLLEDNKRENLGDLQFSGAFPDTRPKVQSMKEKN